MGMPENDLGHLARTISELRITVQTVTRDQLSGQFVEQCERIWVPVRGSYCPTR